MSRSKTKSSPAKRDTTSSTVGQTKIGRVMVDADLAASLSVLYHELAIALREHDEEAVELVRRAIREAQQPPPVGPIDRPLLPMKAYRKHG